MGGLVIYQWRVPCLTTTLGGRMYPGFKRKSLTAQFRHTCLGCWRPCLSLAEFPVVQCLEKSNSSHQIFRLKSKVYSYHFPQHHRNKHHINMVFFSLPLIGPLRHCPPRQPQICHTPWSSTIHRWGNLGNVDRGKLAGRIKIHQDPKMSLNLRGVYFQKWLQHLFWPQKSHDCSLKFINSRNQKHGEPLQLLNIWKYIISSAFYSSRMSCLYFSLMFKFAIGLLDFPIKTE